MQAIIIKSYKSALILTVFTVSMILSACTTLTIPPKPVTPTSNKQQTWQKYQSLLYPLNYWDTSGVIGIRMDDKGQSANFIWQENKLNFYLQISGPLGVGAVILKGNPVKVTLTTSDAKVYSAKSATALMDKQLGWHVPVYGLYYWGRALPDPNSPFKYILNNLGLLATLNQDGWEINYKNYQLQANKYPLPGKIIMTNGNLKIIAVIKAWHLRDE